jgi:hypothetical protein
VEAGEEVVARKSAEVQEDERVALDEHGGLGEQGERVGARI